jgi:hypothetical protein
MPGLKGETFSAIIANLHFVQLNVPERGFGSELDAMVEFCLEHGEEFRIGCFRESEGRDCVIFCFGNPRNAAEFPKRFSGKIFAVPSDDDFSFREPSADRVDCNNTPGFASYLRSAIGGPNASWCIRLITESAIKTSAARALESQPLDRNGL